MIFDVLETVLKFNDFSWLPSGSRRLRQHGQGVVTGWFPGHTPPSRMRAVGTIQETQYNIKHAGIEGDEKNRMQNERNAEDTGCRCARCFAAWWPLHRGAGGFASICLLWFWDDALFHLFANCLECCVLVEKCTFNVQCFLLMAYGLAKG